MSASILIYKLAGNNKISNYTSNRPTSENRTDIAHVDSTVNTTDSFGGRILIVDDDPDITLSFSIGLEDGGFEVYTYNDSLDALANFKPNFYDLLLVDINMPKMIRIASILKMMKIKQIGSLMTIANVLRIS